MIFRQVNEIRSGKKIMTQRVDDGGYTIERGAGGEIIRVFKNGRLKWEVGRTYAAMPKRGMKRFGNYRITRIRHRLIQQMTEADAVREGVADITAYRVLWASINGKHKGKRWEDAPKVFAIEFEYVGDVEAAQP